MYKDINRYTFEFDFEIINICMLKYNQISSDVSYFIKIILWIKNQWKLLVLKNLYLGLKKHNLNARKRILVEPISFKVG